MTPKTTPLPNTQATQPHDGLAPQMDALKLDTMIENALQHPQEKRSNILAFPRKALAVGASTAGLGLAACWALFFVVSTPYATAEEHDDLMYLDMMILEMSENL